MSIARFSADAPVAEVVAALRATGVAVIDELADEATIDRLAADLRPEFDRVGTESQSDFNGYTTLRLNSVLELSPAASELVAHRRVIAILDQVLLPYCQSYQAGSHTAIEIHPGEQAQVLHRDDSIYPMRIPGLELQASVMWALNEFTEENGATHVVPLAPPGVGPDDGGTPVRYKAPDPSESVQAPMSKGSALFYLGSVWHGGGANRANAPRMGLVNTYCLGWLRPEVNHNLTIPQDVAVNLPDPVKALIGYRPHGTSLGWYPAPNGSGWVPG